MHNLRKSIVLLLLTICCIFSIYASAEQSVTVVINGKELSSESAIVVNGSVMLPFRAVFNALGIPDNQILWSDSSKSIEVQAEKKYIFLVVGSNRALIDSKLITLNAAPFIKDGRTYVPVRFVAEALGANVSWNANSRTVTITK